MAKERPTLPRCKTIEEGRKFLNNNYRQGVSCPCCDGYVKEYRRSMYYKIAMPLIRLYRQSLHNPTVPIYIRDFDPEGNGRDFGQVTYWGLAYLQPKSEDKDRRTSGMWFIGAAV